MEPYAAGSCEACGTEYETPFKTLRNEDRHSTGTCHICTRSYCADCQYWCDCCDKTVCKGCTEKCKVCNTGTCKPCLLNGACRFCADDEDARIEAIAAQTKADYDHISRFHNGTWFALSAFVIGCAIGIVYRWIYGW